MNLQQELPTPSINYLHILRKLFKFIQTTSLYLHHKKPSVFCLRTYLKQTATMSYYDPKDLRKFGNITEWSEELGTKFFDYYAKVFEEGKLTAREKSLIALAVAHTEQCPYCIDAYTKDGLQRGVTKEEMMEAVHVGAAIKSGATLVHGVMMMNKVNKLDG